MSCLRSVAAVLLLIALPVYAAENDQRARFKQAYAAARSGDTVRALKLAEDLTQYPLYQYLEYEHLNRRLHLGQADAVRKFLTEYEGDVLADRLRTQWLKTLARQNRWTDFLADYRPQQDTTIQCQWLSARIRQHLTDGLAADALPLWLVGKSQPDECDQVFSWLKQNDELTDERIWSRLQLALGKGQKSLAAYLARNLQSSDYRALGQQLLKVHDDPAKGLQAKMLVVDSALNRSVVLHGVNRLAARDLDLGMNAWHAVRDRYAFTPEERAHIDYAFADQGFRQQHPDTAQLLDAVPPAQSDATLDSLRLRHALKTLDWEMLLKWTSAAPAAGTDALAWRYWHARALEETGNVAAANTLFSELAQQRDYYGFAAADRVGLPYAMNDHPLTASEAEKTAVLQIGGIARAHELLALGERYYARREWHFELPRLSARQTEVAALLAHEWQWYDRAIMALGQSQTLDAMEIRFPLEHLDLVTRYAEKRGMPVALLYSIIRAESAFMQDARSGVGAVGLMQLMPATAKETANRIGFRYENANQLLQADTNVTLGSAYLKQVYDRFNQSFPLAAGAYNAGPGRILAWKPKNTCMPADVWIETVPFRETRGYIMRTLFYAAVYEWRLEQEVTKMKERMAVVTPNGGALSC